MRRTTGLALAGILMAGMLVPMSSVSAGDSDVKKSGGCSETSTWKLKLSDEDGSIEVEFEVDQNVVGDKWRVTLKNDGNRFFRGTRKTKAPSGSFEVRKLTNNGDGSDRIVGRARNLSTDELCRGAAKF